MTEQPLDPQPEDEPQLPDEPQAPAWDREAARARYRKMMRGPFMRGVGIITVVAILLSWAWGAAAAFAPNVEHLPNHDFGVPTQQCIVCHTRQLPNQQAEVPRMPHPAAPSCGFCHRQSFPSPANSNS